MCKFLSRRHILRFRLLTVYQSLSASGYVSIGMADRLTYVKWTLTLS